MNYHRIQVLQTERTNPLESNFLYICRLVGRVQGEEQVSCDNSSEAIYFQFNKSDYKDS